MIDELSVQLLNVAGLAALVALVEIFKLVLNCERIFFLSFCLLCFILIVNLIHVSIAVKLVRKRRKSVQFRPKVVQRLEYSLHVFEVHGVIFRIRY